MPILWMLAPWLAVSVAAGDNFTCAVTRSQSVKCWGINSTAELGDGSTSTRHLPVEVLGVRGVTRIAAGTHACAAAGGNLWCWGGDFWVGNHTRARRFPAYGTVASFSVGGDYTCAVDARKKLRCGGQGEDRILVASMDKVYGAEQPGPVPGLDVPTRQAAAGTFHACALGSDGCVRCWGSNSWSHIVPGEEKSISAPHLVEDLDEVSQLVAGATHTCAVRGGEVWCWGYNINGQLGDGTVETHAEPKKVQLPRVVKLSAGAFTNCAIDERKAVWCWGDSLFGAAGSKDGNVLRPRQMAGLADIRDVSCGGNHCCAVAGNGRVKCWGSNQFGQLGAGRTVEQSATPLDVVQSY